MSQKQNNSPEETPDSLEGMEDIQSALAAMGLQLGSPEPELNSTATKLQLLTFVKEVYFHNQGVEWEINKTKPQPISIGKIITGAQKLFDFVTS
tara:strand:+ start:859 stop:1140 length:282 start_codon:yes stop_codon:yes gene_type:complete